MSEGEGVLSSCWKSNFGFYVDSWLFCKIFCSHDFLCAAKWRCKLQISVTFDLFFPNQLIPAPHRPRPGGKMTGFSRVFQNLIFLRYLGNKKCYPVHLRAGPLVSVHRALFSSLIVTFSRANNDIGSPIGKITRFFYKIQIFKEEINSQSLEDAQAGYTSNNTVWNNTV